MTAPKPRRSRAPNGERPPHAFSSMGRKRTICVCGLSKDSPVHSTITVDESAAVAKTKGVEEVPVRVDARPPRAAQPSTVDLTTPPKLGKCPTCLKAPLKQFQIICADCAMRSAWK